MPRLPSASEVICPDGVAVAAWGRGPSFYIVVKYKEHKHHHGNHFPSCNSAAFGTFITVCNRQCMLRSQNIFITLQGVSIPTKQPFPSPPSRGPWKPLICLLSPWIHLFGRFHKKWNQMLCGLLHRASCTGMFSRSIHAAARVSASLPFMAE